jgi:hypothetical protein
MISPIAADLRQILLTPLFYSTAEIRFTVSTRSRLFALARNLLFAGLCRSSPAVGLDDMPGQNLQLPGHHLQLLAWLEMRSPDRDRCMWGR